MVPLFILIQLNPAALKRLSQLCASLPWNCLEPCEAEIGPVYAFQ